MMTILKLAIKSIRYRKSTLILSIVSIAFSVVLLLGIERLRNNIEQSFTNTLSGTDLIVGAQTGNLSLLLSTVFHKGNVNQNISWESYDAIKNNPKVNWTIPIALGDSHKSFVVIGTTDAFFKHYKFGNNQVLKPKSGKFEITKMKTVIGAKVAEALKYNVNDAVVLTHGMGAEDFANHKDNPFTVSAILKPTGTPIDNTVLVSLNDLENIHNHFYQQDIDPFEAMEKAVVDHEHNHEHDHDHSYDTMTIHPNKITACFIGLKNKSEILQLQRKINDTKKEALTAIMPAVILLELWSVINPIENVLKVISIIVLLISLGSILTNIFISLRQRRREMSILRSIGARPRLIFGLIILEAVGIVCLGILLGILLLILALFIAKPMLSENFGILIQLWDFDANDALILAAILVSGFLIGIFPALQSYKQTLGDGLTIKY